MSFAQSATTTSLRTWKIEFKLKDEEYKQFMSAANIIIDDARRAGATPIIPEPAKVGNLARAALKIFVTEYMATRFKIMSNDGKVSEKGLAVLGKEPNKVEEFTDVADEL